MLFRSAESISCFSGKKPGDIVEPNRSNTRRARPAKGGETAADAKARAEELRTWERQMEAELKAQKRNALEVSTPDTTFLMYADSEKEKDDWIGAIGRAIVRCSSTYTNEDGMDDEERDSDESN